MKLQIAQAISEKNPTMDYSEVDSFISKFKHLWQLGLKAHLDLDTKAGQVWVGLHVHLGHAPGPLYKQEHFVLHPRRSTRNSPSRLRRRARRAAVKQEQQQNQEVISNDAIEENETYAEEAATGLQEN